MTGDDHRMQGIEVEQACVQVLETTRTGKGMGISVVSRD